MARGGTGTIIGAMSDSLIAGNGTGMSAVGGTAAIAGIQVTRSSIVNNLTTGAGERDRWAGNIFSSNDLIAGNGTGLSSVGGGIW